jgi:hypothetical protein
MVEVGSLQIGGSIHTADIERGMTRIETGFKDVSRAGKSVEGDFERIAARSGRLVTILGGLAIAGTTAMVGLAKDAPAVAGSMAKIDLAMMKLKHAAGRALKPAFDFAADALNRLANWVNEHPDLFGGIVASIGGLAAATGIIKVGGWVYGAFSTFWGLLTKIGAWAGWTKIAKGAATIGKLAKGAATGGGRAVSTTASGVAGTVQTLTTATGVGATTAAGVAGTAQAFMLGPLINTYQREITGQPGFLDKALKEYQNWQFWENYKKANRKGAELDMMYFV